MRKLAILLLLFLTMLIGCDLLGGKEKHTPEVPGKIVFAMRDNSADGDYRIFKMNTDGSDVKKITKSKHGEDSTNPSWSPDGKQIVFQSSLKSATGSSSLYLMNADGTNVRPMKTNYIDFPVYDDVPFPGRNPTWSPDGQKIAFQLCLNCEAFGQNSELFVYDFNTDEITKVTDNLARDYYPQWVSDHTLAFLSNRDYYNTEDDHKRDLYEVDIESGDIQRMTESGDISHWVWNSMDQIYLIRSGQPPFVMNYINSRTGDISEATDLALIIGETQYITQWTKDGRYLMLFKSINSSYQLNFYDFYQDTIVVGTSLQGISGFDWYYEENE